MKIRNLNLKQLVVLLLFLCASAAKSQETPIIKYFDVNTIDEVKIDYDNDGDVDYIMAGVIPERDQGRIYLVENKGNKFGKPEYIYSFPTIPVKQQLTIHQKDNITTINIIGTSPTGEETKIIVTLYKGKFEGMLLPPITSDGLK
jgi:hypothetical protein